MKKNPQLIVFIPILIGMGFIIAGIATGRPELVAPVGVAILFGGSFLTAVIIVIVTLAKAFKEPDNKTKSETERDLQSRLNSSNSTERKMAEAESAIRNSASTYKNASKGDRIKGCIFVLAFLGCAFTGVILLTNELFIPGGILFGTAFLIIIGGAIASSSAMRRSLSRHYNPADYTKKRAVVKNCSVASTTTVNGRVTKVVYSVTVEADGVQYTAYSMFDYAYGDELDVLIHKNGKTVKIMDTVISHGDGYDDEDDTEYGDRKKRYDDDYDDDDYDEESEDEDDENEADEDKAWDDDMDFDEFDKLSGKEIRDRELKKREEILKRYGLMDEDGNLTDSKKPAQKPAPAVEPEPVVTPEPEPEVKDPTVTEEIEKPVAPEASAKPDTDAKKPNVGYKGINRKK